MTAFLFAVAGAISLSFSNPLASGHLNFCDNLRRFDIALAEPMDLSEASGVSFELKCMDPAVIENVWLLFKSGAGYYRAAADRPLKAGVWTPTTVAKADVRLYHWDAHMSLWEKLEHPAAKDIPDWSRVEGFQVVVAIDIDETSKDASVAARGFAPVFEPIAPRPIVVPEKLIARLPGERRLICTHVWGVDHDWDKTCLDLVKYGITDVSPLIAHGGYAYYKTRFGVEHPLVAKYGDALKLSVEACHKHGMKCHPRRSCWSLGFNTSAETLASFRKDGRLQISFDGNDGAWLCPTHPANLCREVEGMLELAEAGADGIMIDFFRYPNPDFCFCDRCRKKFETMIGRKVEPWPQAVRSDKTFAQVWSRFRCDVMSEAFGEVSRQVKKVAPQLELSAAVSATVKGAEDRGQDWPHWCRDGGLDVLYPMCYYSTEKMLKRDLVGLKAAVAGTRTKLVPILAFASGDIPFVEPAGFARQIKTQRTEGLRDLAFFRLQEYAPICLDAVFVPESGESAKIRAVQLDLARQKESPSFVSNYMSRVRSAGYNTMVLYLEDRVKTASYPYPADADSYSPSEMAALVRHGVSLGLDVVPVISPLGHTERFLAHPELAKFGEQCEGVGRWGKTDNPGCFCLENPEARAWMEKYIAEVAALFPGKNLHLGFDETWNLGYCTRCRPLAEKDGLAALYMRHVNWAHGLARKLGKRMWMWDDFFEYFDPKVLETVPRDIMMCQWNYDRNIERTGPRSHFGGRLRRDILKTYERLGFECLVCPWFDYENVRTFAEYAASRKAHGYFFTQWEMETDFHSIFFPRVLAAAELWSNRGGVVSADWIDKGLAACYPTVDEDTRRMLKGLMFDQSKLKFTTVTTNSILNGVHENSKLDYWRTALAMIQAQPSCPGVGTIPSDPFSEAAFLEDVAVRTEMAILCEETRNVGRYLLMPDRLADDSRSAKARLREIGLRWGELVARREEQWKAWRPGIRSKKEASYRAHLPNLIAALQAAPDVAKDDEWLLEVDLAMIDTHGAPKCTAEVKIGTEWVKVSEGVWKPLRTDHPYAPKLFPVRIAGEPSALRLTCSGYGDCGLCHVSLRNRSRRFVPSKVVSTSGRVQDAENLLIDDFRGMRFGLPDCTAVFCNPELASRKSLLELELTKEK